MTDLEDLTVRVEAMEKRNAAVSLDKKWETSWTRRLAIAVLTYVIVWAYLNMIGNADPWINAIVPPAGFLLSTLALHKVRQYWQGKNSL